MGRFGRRWALGALASLFAIPAIGAGASLATMIRANGSYQPAGLPISFTLASYWTPAPTTIAKKQGAWFYAISGDATSTVTLQTTDSQVPTFEALETMAKSNETGFRRADPRASFSSRILHTRNGPVDEITARYTVSDGQGGKVHAVAVGYWLLHGHVGYVMTFNCPVGQFSSLLHLFVNTVNSIHFRRTA